MAFVDLQIIGLDALEQNLAALGRLSLQESRVPAACFQEGEEMMALSKRQYAPVRNRGGGALRGSGQVNFPQITGDQVEVTLGYGGVARAYAFRTHENPRTGKTGGRSPSGKKYRSWSEVGQWKFLETPVQVRKQNFYDALGVAMRADISERFGRG